MKKLILIITGATILLSSSLYAADPAQYTTFWGKITSVDLAQKKFVVYNRKKKKDLNFVWNEKTKMSDRKLPIKAEQLESGQFLKVTYLQKENQNWAQEVAVRPEPFRKVSTKSN